MVCAMEGCGRPVWIGGGIEHKFCGRTHAREALLREGKELAAPHGSCHLCKKHGCHLPVFVEENGRVHEFCSRAHASGAIQNSLHPHPNKRTRYAAPPDNRCSFPSCASSRFEDERGFKHDFCGRTHAAKAAEIGLAPVPPALGGKISRMWRGRSGAPAYTLAVLTKAHTKFASVVKQFSDAWQHPGPKPTVMRVLQIRNPEHIYNRYTEYKENLELYEDGKVAEERRFHGTSMAPSCSFAIDEGQAPCLEPSCGVCNICATSFEMARSGTGPNATNAVATQLPNSLRYGKGLYFSKASSKSDAYANETERGTMRVIFLCKVAHGNIHTTVESSLEESRIDQLVEARRQGGKCHSVMGNGKDEGGPLNYHETVVYTDEAAIPSYLVVYDSKPTPGPTLGCVTVPGAGSYPEFP